MLLLLKIVKTSILIIILSSTIYSQENDYPWQKILEKDGLNISFIFYSSSVRGNNGVVLKLHNKTENKLEYDFEVVFRSDTLEHSETVIGTINPHETITGSEKKLFWVPFKNGLSIGEVGVRKCRITILN